MSDGTDMPSDDHMYLHCSQCVAETHDQGLSLRDHECLEVYVEPDGVTLVIRCARHDGTLARYELKEPVGLPCACSECRAVVGGRH
jgi:hypothetical protein